MNDTTKNRELPLPSEEEEISPEFQTPETTPTIEVSPEVTHEEVEPDNGIESNESSIPVETSEEFKDKTIKEISDMKAVVLDSADLATRAAGLGVQASHDMKEATEKLMVAFKNQKTNTVITLTVLGAIVFLTLLIFAIVSIQITSRVSQLDAMVLAVGKRVVSMDTSISNVNSASDMLISMAKKQNEIINTQGILENKIEEIMRTTAILSNGPGKQADATNQNVITLVKSLDTRIALQSKAISSISSQMQKLKTATPQTNKLKQEIEALAKKQREYEAQEATAAAASALNQQKINAEEEKKNMVRFPRVKTSMADPSKH